ncbi:MAG TPA: Uma2 family endonuclease [Blastocatellia bacterium]|nr:Uma2 family endonuclease [Blastocatellia bacterium]
MASAIKLTIADLEALPENGNRYELIEGELYVSTQPHWFHQRVWGELFTALSVWSKKNRTGSGSLSSRSRVQRRRCGCSRYHLGEQGSAEYH